MYGNTALHLASQLCSGVDIIQKLLEYGGDPSIQNKFGNTELHDASRLCHRVDIIQKLLDHGGDPTIQNEYGETPMDIAYKKRNEEIYNLLRDWIDFFNVKGAID